MRDFEGIKARVLVVHDGWNELVRQNESERVVFLGADRERLLMDGFVNLKQG